MANNLERLARRMEDDPFFVACPLALYAQSEKLDEQALAARLRCSDETLALVRLCRAPMGEADSFVDDVERIAEKYSIDPRLLAQAIRRGQAILQMRNSTPSTRTLLAARDHDDPSTPDQEANGEP